MTVTELVLSGLLILVVVVAIVTVRVLRDRLADALLDAADQRSAVAETVSENVSARRHLNDLAIAKDREIRELLFQLDAEREKSRTSVDVALSAYLRDVDGVR